MLHLIVSQGKFTVTLRQVRIGESFIAHIEEFLSSNLFLNEYD